MLQCDWSAWTDGKEWEAETKMDRLRTLTGLKRLHIYIGGPFPDELTCVWERFQVCPLKTATVTVQKNGSQVYSYIGQSTVDACEGMISTMLTDWSESDGRQRLAKLEARIATEREAVDRSMSLNGYERPGEDWFG